MTDRLIVDKQKMLSHKINSGSRIVSRDGRRCIKGAFIDALVSHPELPKFRVHCGSVYREENSPHEEWVYLTLLGHWYADSEQFAYLKITLDKYEDKLRAAKEADRQKLLGDCVAELEEHDLVDWLDQQTPEKEPVPQVLVSS